MHVVLNVLYIILFDDYYSFIKAGLYCCSWVSSTSYNVIIMDQSAYYFLQKSIDSFVWKKSENNDTSLVCPTNKP